ncbi:unnamed protein product [Owenia fusiformis]|uniref:Uncharacterized protein n=1 Tax=Owenia fusiformis TaxID=6347 RepID=A0A8J1Y4L3_OWEFU|nr:unnamed protein product [Owenia fusiformis]
MKKQTYLHQDSFEHVSYPPQLPKSPAPFSPPEADRKCPMCREEYQSYLDCDGRLVDEHRFRKAVFRGGVSPDIRVEVWQFLFGLYPFTSTTRERSVMLADYHVKYQALKTRWKQLLCQHVQCNKELNSEKFLSPCYLQGSGYNIDDTATESSQIPTSQSLSSPEIQQQITFMKLQATVYAGRQNIDIGQLKPYIRVIDKDVPRTDRDVPYFSGDSNPHLAVLRDILITFAAYHPTVGYAQGMNDILSRFLVIFDSEVEAYWCFSSYLETIKQEFMEKGMMRKLELLQQLLIKLDPDLFNYLDQCEVGDLTLCHRWLLLGFKREFPYDDSLRCFEILSSHHLEMTSMEAEKVRDVEIRKDFEQQEGKVRNAEVTVNTEFTFDLFMCVTVLMEHREKLFRCTDPAEIFQVINSLTMCLKLEDVFSKSETMFFKYCRKSVLECFEVLDVNPAMRKIKKK